MFNLPWGPCVYSLHVTSSISHHQRAFEVVAVVEAIWLGPSHRSWIETVQGLGLKVIVLPMIG